MYKSAGVSQGEDLNSGNILGFSEATAGSYDGIRQWAGGNYKFGPNVTLWTETHVSKIVSQGSRATGIEYLRPVTGTSGSVSAKKEVIVSSGAQGSPKLLLLRSVACPRYMYEMLLTNYTVELGPQQSYKSTALSK